MFELFARWSPFDHNGLAASASAASVSSKDFKGAEVGEEKGHVWRNHIKRKIAGLGIRLVNEARVEFLRSLGWQPRLVRFVPET